jgi:TPR repeat protein
VDAIIKACSIVIVSDSDGPKETEALLIRGAAYRLKHEYAKAYQDLNKVALSHFASDKTAAAAARLLGTMSMLGELETLPWARQFPMQTAMSWFQRAAWKGDSFAMANIASLYAKGQGVAKDCDAAQEWAQKAIAAGYESAREQLRSGFGGQCQW